MARVHAQGATILAHAVTKGSDEPLPFTTVAIPSHGIRRLTTETGMITVRGLAPGDIALQFRRIGFAPKDTVLTVGANDTVRVRVEMERLVLQLPTLLVNGSCTDRTPFEDKTPVLAALFDQVNQNAERLMLLAKERPFVLEASHEEGLHTRSYTPPTRTYERRPLPDVPYIPGHIYWKMGKNTGIQMPELVDLADTAFTNNHCFHYAGQTRFGADSVIQVDFEPVPWLAKDVDLEGSLYLRVDGYRLVGLVTRLNRMIPGNTRTVAYATRASFKELVSDIPLIAEWEVTNTMKDSPEPIVVATGRVMGVRWLDPSGRDTMSSSRSRK